MKAKTLTYWKKKAWAVCSQYVRLLHSYNGYCTCYTCSVVKPIKEMQAGHGFSGRGNSILFNLDIIRPQCYGCNICNSGKLDIFTFRLRKEHGDKKYNELWALRDVQRKYTIPELQEMIYDFKTKIKKLEKEKL
jgi:hypothetical protein